MIIQLSEARDHEVLRVLLFMYSESTKRLETLLKGFKEIWRDLNLSRAS